MTVDNPAGTDAGYSVHADSAMTIGPVSLFDTTPDNKIHGANMGPIWVWQDPAGPHVGPMNLAIWDAITVYADRAMSSRWRQMSWRQTGAKTSATTMLTGLRLYCHMSHTSWHAAIK